MTASSPAPRDDTGVREELYLDGIRAENGEMVIDLHDAGQTLAHMALAMRTFWEGNASEGTNYVQTGVRHEGKTWNFVVYPAGKPTPHDLRRKAEAERDEAVAAVQRVRALAEETRRHGQESYMGDPGDPGTARAVALYYAADQFLRALDPTEGRR